MTTTPQQRKKLRKVLLGLSSPDEQDALLSDESQSLDERMSQMQESGTTLSKSLDGISKSIENLSGKGDIAEVRKSLELARTETRKILQNNANLTSSFQEALVSALKELKDTFVTTATANKPQDYSGFFKDFPTLLTGLTSSTQSMEQTSQIIRNLKWNASQQLRDVNGSPINPSIAPFGITNTYDDVKLTNYDGSGNVGTVTYFQNGNIKAQLQLTYDGSGNLTDVTRSL